MTASNSLYPSLGRFFKTQEELAHAGCMSRTRLTDCLAGRKEFTEAEKRAIAANIVVYLLGSRSFDCADLERAVRAHEGRFDEEYRVKTHDRRKID